MKKKWILLKILLLLIGLTLLVAFSQNRYDIREVKEVKTKIDYSHGNHFITHQMVDSLLKKTHPDYPEMGMKRVYIKDMEYILNQDNFISHANVYLENDGVLYAEITQEIPVLRVHNKKNEYYISQFGKQIPLSPHFSARVLLAEGDIEAQEHKGLVELVQRINDDNLLKNLVIGIRKEKLNSFILLIDDEDYFLELGKLEELAIKLENFKVFYHKYISKTKEIPYKKLNLKFTNQIIAIK
ncbi:MAG: hypothetical protein Q4G27_08945 [Flavobacteriaceae bacterium]|nr:hypothetical protein [Flavobacteriaceae bacterium]